MENSINKINAFTEKVETEKNDIDTNQEKIDDLNIENVSESPKNMQNEIKENSIINNKILEKDESENNSSQVGISNNYIQEIEDIILEDGIREVYEKMNIKKQKKFEKDLKKTSIEISNILSKFKDNILKVINKIFSLVKKLVFQLGMSDYGYTEKMIKNKVENIIKIKRGEDK